MMLQFDYLSKCRKSSGSVLRQHKFPDFLEVAILRNPGKFQIITQTHSPYTRPKVLLSMQQIVLNRVFSP